MTIIHFLGRVVFCILVFMETHQANGEGKEDLMMMGELSSREEAVKWAGYGEEKLSTVVVGGKLLCHAAASHHKVSSHPYPVSGARLAVFCGTSGRTKRSWAKGSTDNSGVFLIDLPSHLHAIPNLEKICLVKVLHLPKSSPCGHAFTGKHKGILLTSVGEGIRIYTTNNIHLMPKPSHKYTRDGSKKERKVSGM